MGYSKDTKYSYRPAKYSTAQWRSQDWEGGALSSRLFFRTYTLNIVIYKYKIKFKFIFNYRYYILDFSYS